MHTRYERKMNSSRKVCWFLEVIVLVGGGGGGGGGEERDIYF